MRDQVSLVKYAPILLLLFSFRLPAAAADFSAAGSSVVGKDPAAVAVGDFDGDGKLDAVVANFGSDNVSVLLGNGDGTLREPQNYRVGVGPKSITVGDFDADGKLDLAVANSGSNNLSVLLGKGDGTFRRALNCDVGMRPQFVAAADFNGDGKMDLAVATSGSNGLSVLLGNGDATFQSAQNYRFGTGPQSLALGDFNSDGALDVAVANAGSNNVTVLLGKGDGTFQTAANYAVGKNPYFIAVGDFDGDGKPDLAVTTRAGKNVSVLLAKGDGMFHEAVGYVAGTKARGIAAGDFNGDSRPSLAVANPDQSGIGMLLGRADGSFLAGPSFSAGSGPSSIAAGDFNGDGAPDMVVANALSNDVTVLLNCPVVKLSPGSLKFGVRGAGTQSAAMPVTLANIGSAPLLVTRIDLTGKHAHEFAQTNTCPLTPFSLAAHQTCTLNLTFTPTAKGTRKAALTVTDNAAGSPHTVTLSGGDPAASTVWKGGAGNWSDPSKWTSGVPTSAVDALIDNGNATASPVTLDIGGQTNNLTIDSDDSLSFNNGTSLTINGSSIGNGGTISLNSVGSLTTLFVATGATLTGIGAVTMSNNPQNQVDGNGGATLTNKSTIQGGGMIGPHFVLANQGTVNANVNGGILAFGAGASGAFSNSSTLEATNGGILQIFIGGGGSLNNTGGTITAVGSNSQVQPNASITGGTLTTSSGGTIVQATGSSSLTALTNSGTFSLMNGTSVNLSGTITNTGNFQLNSAGNLTNLFVPTAATLTGSGTVTMSNNSQNQVDGNGGATLTNQSTIQGGGTIGPHFTLANQGTVNANVNGAILALGAGNAPGYTNTATLEATNGGILQINTGGPGTLDNTGGTIKAVGANSQVQFPGSGNNITGGTLSTSSGGTIVQTAGSSTLTNVTNSGTFQIQNGSFVNLSGTLTNNGTLQINSGGSLTGLNLPTVSAALGGTGKVILNNNPASVIDGNGGLTFTNQSTIQGGGTIGPHVTFNNKGTLNATAANTLNINAPFVNFSGTTLKGGKYLVTGTLQFTGANIVSNASNITLSGTTSQIIDQNSANGLANFAANAAAGSFTLTGNRNFTTVGSFRNSGAMKISAGSTFALAPFKAYTQNGGTTIVDGNLKAGLINIQAGNVFGTKTLRGSVQSSGTITPGDSPTLTGLLAITGAYTQNSTGNLNISIGGLTAGTQFGQLNVTSTATLNGTLNVSLINGFVPNIGDSFDILNASSVTGTFATVNGLCIDSSESFTVTYNANDVVLTVVSGPCM